MAEADTKGLPSETQPAATSQTTAPAPGTPEYEAAMAAKFDQTQPQAATPAAVPVKPEGIPEKFWDAEKGVVRTEDLLKSYQELEKKQTTPAATDPTKAAPVTPDPATATQADAQEALASKGLDMSTFSSEFQTNGALSDDSYTKLEAAGIPKNMVDAYIEGQKAVAAQRDAVGYELAGGKDSFNKMADWAKTAMPVDERIALNKAFAGSDAEMKLAVTSLRAKYEAANGREPNLAGGQTLGSSGSSGYESRAQMVADMKDPRYSKDPAYRAKVEAKLASTTAF